MLPFRATLIPVGRSSISTPVERKVSSASCNRSGRAPSSITSPPVIEVGPRIETRPPDFTCRREPSSGGSISSDGEETPCTSAAGTSGSAGEGDSAGAGVGSGDGCSVAASG